MITKKTYLLDDLDCAVCAAKIENAVAKLDGVKSASVSFMTKRMRIEAEDEKHGDIIKSASAICRKIEPDCTIKAL